jgi:hypothetical protein
MRRFSSFMTYGVVIAVAGNTLGCGGGHRMHQHSGNAPGNQGSSVSSTTSTAPATTLASASNVVVPQITMTETQPTTPKSYAAAAPSKPKITGISEDELERCEAELPTLDTCKPSRTVAEGQAAVVDEVRACVARYVAALDGCMCKAGSQPHCKYAEEQKRELAKMGK